MGLGQAIASHWSTFATAIAADIRTIGDDDLRTRRAIATGIATALAVLVALWLNLDYPMWSGMTAVTAISPTVRATALKGGMRAVGTIGGALLAAFLLGFIAGDDWAIVAALFTTVSYTLYRSYMSEYPYAWMLGGITLGLVLMQAMADPAIGLHVAAYRAAEILVGVAAAFVAGQLFLPAASDPAHDRALAIAPQVGRPLAIRTSLEAGTGLCLVVWLYDLLALPGFASAGVSLTRVVDPNPELGRHRAFLRILGCSIGGGAGLLMVGASIDSLPVFLFVIFVFCSIFGYFIAGSAASAYAGIQAGFAFIIAYAPSVTPPATLDPAIDRFAGIFVALLVFWAVDALFASDPAAAPEKPTG